MVLQPRHGYILRHYHSYGMNVIQINGLKFTDVIYERGLYVRDHVSSKNCTRMLIPHFCGHCYCTYWQNMEQISQCIWECFVRSLLGNGGEDNYFCVSS